MSTITTALTGGALFRSDEFGDVTVSTYAGGLFVSDTRLLSEWRVRIAGMPLQVIGDESPSPAERRISLVPMFSRGEPPPVTVQRAQHLTAAGLTEVLRIDNLTAEPRTVDLTVAFRADFLDQFALRSDRRRFDLTGGSVRTAPTASGVALHYTRALGDRAFTASIEIAGKPAPTQQVETTGRAASGTLAWIVTLPPHGSAAVEVVVQRRDLVTDDAGPAQRAEDDPSLVDLDALLMACPGLPELRIPGAGAPWFLTLFGRDALITSLLLEQERQRLLPDVLRALAIYQGRLHDPITLEQPGRIVHEVRVSELAALGFVPFGRYYGSVDATPLFLMGVARFAAAGHETWHLLDAARRAVDWMRRFGGLDEHGLLTYASDPRGLIHQGWKDSFDAVSFPDGRLAEGPFALLEPQAYAWRALTDLAALARGAWNEPDWADELQSLATGLHRRLLNEFWDPDEDFPALALDGAGRRVSTVGSAAGHLLWVGALDAHRAERVIARLMQPDMFTGFGIRTLSSEAARYNPLSYHNGSVWPHDTAIAVLGMLHYGARDAAQTVARGMLQARAAFRGRLPELFAGFDRGKNDAPVAHPYAATPQAWAAAAGAVMARVIA